MHKALKECSIYANYLNQGVLAPLKHFFEYENADSFECVIRLAPDLLKLISKTLNEEPTIFETLKLAHLRCLEFLIEQLGAGLSNQIPSIIKMLIKTCP